MDGLGTNPFGLLTFIVAPAVLTNAASISALATSNRLARATERARAISTQLEGIPNRNDPTFDHYLGLLDDAEKRMLYLVRSLTSFYFSVGSFAAASLVSLLGALFHALQVGGLGEASVAASLIAGICGISGLMCGSGLLVWETRITLRSLKRETHFLLSRHRQKAPPIPSL